MSQNISLKQLKGIIYRRYIINDKGQEVSYIGQTCDPVKRNSDFLNLKVQYAGKRIENARKKYGPENFKYEVLEEVSCSSEEELIAKLDEREIQYINKFDSFRHGYNNCKGGSGAKGYKHTEEYKKWQSAESRRIQQDPEIKHRQIVGMKRYFSTPAAHEKRKAELRKRYEDPNERLKLSVAQKRSYAANPNRAKSRNAKLSQICSTPEGRKRMGLTSHNAWQNPEYKRKQQERMRRQWADPEYLAAYKKRNIGMNGRRVRQLTLSGEVIKEYVSACEAARQIGGSYGSICRVCRHERRQYKGFGWEYTDE